MIQSGDATFTISQKHLNDALIQAQIGFWELDLQNGNSMICTAQCKRNFGWETDKQFSYNQMLSCILAKDLPAMMSSVQHAISNRQLYSAQYRVRHPDGQVIWIEANGEVLFQESLPVKILGTTVNITERKDIEILRDELINVAMHELKTPLSAVRASLQIIERHLKDQQDNRVLTVASRALLSADRISQLLHEISSPVVSASQELKLNKTRFDFCALLKESVHNALIINPECTITIEELDEIIICADRCRIGQVITNLLNNAIKYSGGPAVVDIAVTISRETLTLSVRDYGIGITAIEKMKIFQKFYRVSHAEKIDGLGIGLFLCHELVLKHAGSISVHDPDGRGSVFQVNLAII
ncbi:hypothetical protein OC25_02245 [Pedobacter kyungheensis]|uniref:histidine kinase n=1 Tax=Pedobacter kyungheensis TaxID=1069985 RepID=A0A0C1DG54_9SPHI|nr:PAS domain-containing sensor histidine kinase [Pedobacter kyungheensis]KIA96581.1 hypothetical protein OC25_02245 [Pedobacter kyungheensis]